MKRELICISCPLGCRMTAEYDSLDSITLIGNRCPRGKVYAQNELSNPVRTVTTTVKTRSGRIVPVKTLTPIAKQNIFPLLEALKDIVAPDDVCIGDVVAVLFDTQIVCTGLPA